MFCPLTGKECNKAKTIHIQEPMPDGQISQMHVCDDCVSQLEAQGGLLIEPPAEVPQEGIGSLVSLPIVPLNPINPLAHFLELVKQLEDRHREEQVLKTPCPSCGMTLQEFSQSGKVGCGYCYEFFKHQIGPIIQRVQ
jgi:protein-arginine kinase activator protein McsA